MITHRLIHNAAELNRLRGDLLNVTRNQATTEEPLFQDLLGPLRVTLASSFCNCVRCPYWVTQCCSLREIRAQLGCFELF